MEMNDVIEAYDKVDGSKVTMYDSLTEFCNDFCNDIMNGIDKYIGKTKSKPNREHRRRTAKI